MSLSLRFAAGSHKGMIREGNEDSGYAGPRLLAVADGMGGQAAGEVASSEVLSTIVELDEDVPGADLLDALRSAVDRANDRLRVMVDDDPQLEGMGTTLTALLWTGSRLGLAHIGDSRAYLLRDGALEQITQDHTWVQRLVDEGRITEEEADHHPQRSLLMRALDGRGHVEPDLSVREARPGDRYLICSDGLSGVVSRETMEATLLTYGNPGDAVQELIQLALRGGGPDNITCIVADVVDPADQPSDSPIVVGAVASVVDDTTTLPTTPASRARELTAGEYETESLVSEPGSRRKPKPKSTLRRTLPIWGGVAVLVAALGGAYYWTQTQYFVADKGDHVAIYRGIDSKILGLNLASTYQSYDDLKLTMIGQTNRDAVNSTLDAASLTEARHTIDRLKRQADVCRRTYAADDAKKAVEGVPGGQPAGSVDSFPQQNPGFPAALQSNAPVAKHTPTTASRSTRSSSTADPGSKGRGTSATSPTAPASSAPPSSPPPATVPEAPGSGLSAEEADLAKQCYPRPPGTTGTN
ncbi:PP2C family protein-serine/threonine phosphatase [Embleya scabrispora]|uniref:PP2C family protein-serine/threonine phosphatase n=1 Tax=Embleya scabrispora TaxID=159449 RepID=UPI000370F145|nr:PP2C family serine/threonine-protein phosphatase [Embleya scabrispora]MYS79772.1 protein phosphatase [Streptomyces sp. SID5474]